MTPATYPTGTPMGPESMEHIGQTPNRCELRVGGTIKGAARIDVDLMVAIETVVPDNEIPEILVMYGARAHTDADGQFVDRYAVPDEIRPRLHGWVMCTVDVRPLVPGVGGYSKVVRWQRQSCIELIAGLGALLAAVSFEVGVVTRDR